MKNSPTTEDFLKSNMIRELNEFDRLSILGHFVSLSAKARRSRFGGCVDDEFLNNYSERILEIGTVVYGIFPDGELRGIGELRQVMNSVPISAELAISVEELWQDRGLGNALMRSLVSAARKKRIKALHMICLSENEKMRHLAEKQNAYMTFDEGQTIATLVPSWKMAPNITERLSRDVEGFMSSMFRW